MSKVRIEVTAEHIANGKKDSTAFCPIALAFKAAGVSTPYVEYETWGSAPLTGNHPLPDEAKTFIQNFDHGAPVAPFAFDAEIS